MISGAEATIYVDNSNRCHPYCLSGIMTIKAASNVAIIITDVLGPSNLWRIWIAGVLMQRNMYPEYDQLLRCFQVGYVDALTDGNGNGNGNDEQWVEATIGAEKWRPIELFAGSPRLWSGMIIMTYIWYKLWVQYWCLHTGYSRSADMENHIAIDVSSFSSIHFSFLFYFFGSRPSTDDVDTGFNHLQQYVWWRWSFPVH